MTHLTESPESAEDFVPFATAALDFHQALNLPAGPPTATRGELDALHAHLAALIRLLDTHAQRSAHLRPELSLPLVAARNRAWKVADHLHTAFHATDLAEAVKSVPNMSVCRRHQSLTHLLRRRATPADLRNL